MPLVRASPQGFGPEAEPRAEPACFPGLHGGAKPRLTSRRQSRSPIATYVLRSRNVLVPATSVKDSRDTN